MLTLLIAATILGLLLLTALACISAPVMRECRTCGEPCAIGVCAACDTPQSIQQRRAARCVHINSARLTRALAARNAIRGDDGLVAVRGRA